MNYRDMESFTAAQRSSQLWLNIDDVLSHVPVSRAQFWKMIKEGSFPSPYRWKKTPLWTQADIRDWINKQAQRVAPPKSDKTPITWESVAEYMKKMAPRGITNRQIAHALNADITDTTNMTRMMAKAGVLLLFKPVRGGSGEPNFYIFNDGTVSKD